MFDVTHKYKGKGAHVFYASVKPNGDHHIHLSAYGTLASDLLEKYLEGQRADNEETFAEWDKSFQAAVSKAGFSSTHQVDDGYVYISTFQSGIGISPEDRIRQGKEALREVRRGLKIAALHAAELEEDLDDVDDGSHDDYEE